MVTKRGAKQVPSTSRTTLDDIARRTGLSRTTVSRALNGHTDVSERTRETIEGAARDLGYYPHMIARRLASGRALAIGAVTTRLPFVREALFIDIIEVLRTQLGEAGYELILGSRNRGVAGVDDALSLVTHRRVDGIVLLETEVSDSLLGRLTQIGCPVVLFGRSPEYPDLPYVDTDGASAVDAAVTYLAGLGHRRIGYISGSLRRVCSVHRLEGYRHAMETRGLPCDYLCMEVGTPDLVGGYMAARALLERDSRLTALVCFSDAAAHGAMRAAYELGLKVPDGLSVIGFDNVVLNDFLTPRLTSVAQRVRDIGMHLARIVLASVRGEQSQPGQVLLGTELIVRESCKAPPATDFWKP